MYKFIQILKRDLFNLILNPMWIFFCTFFPFLLIVILGFLTAGNFGNKVTSYDYYGIAMMIYSILNTATIASNSFMEESIKDGNMRILFSPIKLSYIYFSKIIATFIFASVFHFAIILLMHFMLGVNYGGLSCFIIFLLFEFFSSALGVLFCCIFKSENTANQVLGIIINIFALFGGVFFQMDGLGNAIEKITYISPIKWVLKAILCIIYDKNYGYFLPSAVMLIAVSVIVIILCHILYKTEDYV